MMEEVKDIMKKLMKAKQSAVDYMLKELSAILGPVPTEPMQDLLMVEAVTKAKEMFEEQIKRAYNQGVVNEISIYSTISEEQYYKETYGS